MEILLILLPVLGSLIIWLIGKNKYNRTKILVSSLVSIGLVGLTLLIMSLTMRYSNFNDTEYLSYYYIKVRHEDPWNERVRHVRHVKVGKHTHTQVYYTTKHHSDKWYKYSNDGSRFSIGKSEYESLKHLWSTPERFVDMHRNYYTIDGDAQEHDYCGHWVCLRGYTIEHPYENRISGSSSVLKYKNITNEAKKLHLIDYVTGQHIYGIIPTIEEKQKIDYINCLYGKEKELHLIILIFPSTQGVSIVEDQRAFWQGGNKNELVVCIGVKPGTRDIEWSSCFSWQKDITLDCMIRNFLIKEKQLNLIRLGDYVESNINLWKRREFNEYDYISTYLTKNQLVTLLIVIFVLSIVASIIQFVYLEENGF